MRNEKPWVQPVLAALAAAFLVFVLPWWIPVRQPSYSPSYTYGFNNAAAWSGLGLVLAVSSVWQILVRARSSPGPDGLTALVELLTPSADPPPRSLRLAALAFTLVALAAIAWWLWYLPFAYFGETQYFLPRIDLMLQGQRAYRDFQFSYGPGLLLLPYGLYQAGSASIEFAYGASLLLNWLFGCFCLFYVVRALGGTWARAAVFLLIALTFVNLTFGLNYTPLRFALPLASLLALRRCAHANSRLDRGATLRFFALCGLLPMLNFAVSPEMGIATTAAFLAFATALWRTPQRPLSYGVFAVALCLPLSVLLFSADYFHALFTYAGGGNNLPIFPFAQVIVFLAALLFVVPRLAVLAWENRTSAGALAAALVVLFGLQMVPALGRSDPRHVAMNGFGVLLFALALWSIRHPASFRLGALAFLLVFVGTLQLSGWNTYRDAVFRAVDASQRLAQYRLARGEVDWSAYGRESTFRYDKLLPLGDEYRTLLAYPKIGTPFGAEETVDRLLKFSGRYVPEYFPGPVIDVFREADIARKKESIDRMDTILVPAPIFEEGGRVKAPAVVQRDTQYLSDVLVLPLSLTARHDPFVPSARLMTAIAPEFEAVGKFRRYVILQRKKK